MILTFIELISTSFEWLQIKVKFTSFLNRRTKIIINIFIFIWIIISVVFIRIIERFVFSLDFSVDWVEIPKYDTGETLVFFVVFVFFVGVWRHVTIICIKLTYIVPIIWSLKDNIMQLINFFIDDFGFLYSFGFLFIHKSLASADWSGHARAQITIKCLVKLVSCSEWNPLLLEGTKEWAYQTLVIWIQQCVRWSLSFQNIFL